LTLSTLAEKLCLRRKNFFLSMIDDAPHIGNHERNHRRTQGHGVEKMEEMLLSLSEWVMEKATLAGIAPSSQVSL
jgi:hypothetical protein